MAEKTGRPTIMTKETISKLEEVFAIGGTDKEACFYADISHQTLYDYQAIHPEFVERKEALKERPILKARQTVVKSLENPSDAQWFLERKRKDEFSSRSEISSEINVKVEKLESIQEATKSILDGQNKKPIKGVSRK
jgi:hypothetical protein